MNSNDLADRMCDDHDLSRAKARAFVDGLFAAIVGAVASGEEVSISGFGKFKMKERAEREGRNPATGGTITIAAARKISFAPAKGVKDKLNA